MFDYHTLDAVADAFNPATGLLSLGLIAHPALRRDWRAAGARAFAFAAMLAVVYTLLFVDRAWEPRAAFGVGYSTHTALAIAVTVFNAAHLRSLAALWIGLLLAYASLIVVQGYHGVADLVATGLVIAPVCVAAAWRAVRMQRRSTAAAIA